MSAERRLEGLVLRSMALGESDRLLTLLSEEHGLIRVVAPGARKPKSSLAAAVPLAQLAHITHDAEEPLLWRRNRDLVISVRADVRDGGLDRRRDSAARAATAEEEGADCRLNRGAEIE